MKTVYRVEGVNLNGSTFLSIALPLSSALLHQDEYRSCGLVLVPKVVAYEPNGIVHIYRN